VATSAALRRANYHVQVQSSHYVVGKWEARVGQPNTALITT